jgi:hypothetical protein
LSDRSVGLKIGAGTLVSFSALIRVLSIEARFIVPDTDSATLLPPVSPASLFVTKFVANCALLIVADIALFKSAGATPLTKDPAAATPNFVAVCTSPTVVAELQFQ